MPQAPGGVGGSQKLPFQAVPLAQVPARVMLSSVVPPSRAAKVWPLIPNSVTAAVPDGLFDTIKPVLVLRTLGEEAF